MRWASRRRRSARAGWARRWWRPRWPPRRVQECLAEPFPLESIRVHVGASIGVATAPVPAADVTDLLRCADVAMYAAKTSRDGVRVYLPEPGTETGDRLHTMEELRDALATDQIGRASCRERV